MAKHYFKANSDDLIIVPANGVMGPTGSGKSNFINTITGNTEHRRAGNLQSDTQDVTPYPIPYNGSRLVLVDTPGFDDTYRPDSQILRIVADWLTQKYADGTTLKVTGIVYLHRITDNRVSGSVYRNLQIFGRLCGDVPLHRARLVTTMWDKVKYQGVAESRQSQLKDDFWKRLLEAGALAQKFNNTKACAWDIVHDLIDLGIDGDEELLLQEELVDQQKRLNETEAAKVLYSRLQQLLAEQKRILKDLANEARLANNPSLARSLQEEYDKINAQLQKTFEEMRAMKVPLSRRIVLWLTGRKSRAHAVKLD